MNYDIHRYDSIDSTNIEALKEARLGAEEGLTVIAREQTAGRGRQGRTWWSIKDAGLYLSIVLRPEMNAEFLTLIPLAAAVAVYDSLADAGLQLDIKWPNDILVGEKKVCGILAETAETANGLAVVVGIGINLSPQNMTFAPEATSLADHSLTLTAGEAADRLLEHFDRYYSKLNSDPRSIVDDWKARSSYFMGKQVSVTLFDQTLFGTTDGLEPNGALRVKLADGSTIAVHAGDVERVRASANAI